MPRRLRGLTLWDYSDRELLFIVAEEAGAEGWTATADLAKRLGVDTEAPNQNVGIRMGWMRRYGAIEKNPERAGQWRLTAVGQALMDGELTDRALGELDAMDASQYLMLTRYLTAQWRKSGNTAGHLIRREWRRGTSKRPGQ